MRKSKATLKEEKARRRLMRMTATELEEMFNELMDGVKRDAREAAAMIEPGDGYVFAGLAADLDRLQLVEEVLEEKQENERSSRGW